MAKPKLTPQTPGEPLPEDAQAPEAEATEAAPTSGELLDQDEIDPATLDRPVLSKQGWVLPHKAS